MKIQHVNTDDKEQQSESGRLKTSFISCQAAYRGYIVLPMVIITSNLINPSTALLRLLPCLGR